MFTKSTQLVLKISIMIVLLILISNTFAVAQSQEPKPKLSPNKNWALELKFNNFSSLENFLFAGKRHFSKNSALRISVEIDAHAYKTDSDMNIADPFDTTDYETEQISSYFDLTIGTQVISYSSLKKDLRFYLGAGPQFSYNKYIRDIERTDIQGYYQEDENTYWGVGISSIFGIEWFVAKNVAFLAEYGANFEFGRAISEQTRIDNDGESDHKESSEEDRFSFDGSEAKFGLAFYF
ncbi:MAG: porin family protein [candidate division Zixibacteria bacterium]|nr:porin family protein [candidate division Zixibacteria bacterium]